MMRGSHVVVLGAVAALMMSGCGTDDPGSDPSDEATAEVTEADGTDEPTEAGSSSASQDPEPAEPAPTPTDGVAADLTPGAEVPGPGDDGASGSFVATLELTETGGELCYTLMVEGLSAPATAAHIHAGIAGESGGVLITLTTPVDGQAAECMALNASELVPLLDDAAGHYVNVHTSDFPDGAVRGQLQSA